ncbi:hypothetical protein GCM10017711_11600 [Paeniglutamicibacter sulfureus]
MGLGVGFAVGLGDGVGDELVAVAVETEDELVGSAGTALPVHPAAASSSAPEEKATMTCLVFVNMPEAYDSVGVN